jgi:GrpB-like predicted nucleotidyltransferase (UPF0157 family)
MPGIVILPYRLLPASYHEWDPRAPEVAGLVGDYILQAMPDVTVEHVGSSSVPGIAGKGIVDLMLVYPPGLLPAVRDTLERLGFQHQKNAHPFPEERPMRTGAIEYDGTEFRVHVHVIASNSPEVEEFRLFRDALRRDPVLAARYMARKREILASGITDSEDYSRTKGSFCREVLDELEAEASGATS